MMMKKRSLTSKAILLIDQDEKFRVVARKIYEGQGYMIREARDLKQALSILEDFVPDLIVFDPEIMNDNDINFLELRINDSRIKSIPLLACSHVGRRDTIAQIYGLGVQDIILKPITNSILLQKTKKLIKSKKTLEYTFHGRNRPQVSADLECQIKKINELSVVIRSRLKVPNGQKFQIIIDFFKNEGVSFGRYETSNMSFTVDPGVYDTTFSLVGISENLARKIRKLKNSWKT